MDLFIKQDVAKLLEGKSILFLGDSIMRNIYKDLVWLTSPKDDNKLIPQKYMMAKGEWEFCSDTLLNGSELTAGRNYKEERDWYIDEHDIQYTSVFITRCYSDYLKDFLLGYTARFGSYPDAIFINSALWDINRWGPSGIEEYKFNLHKLMDLLTETLPRHTQVVWMTTPPISVEIRGGFVIPQLEFQTHSMRINIMEANQYAATVVATYGYDVLDMHYYMHMQIHRRAADGIHWNPDAVRMQVNILLTHYALSRDLPLPNRWDVGMTEPEKEMVKNVLLDLAKEFAKAADDDYQPQPLPQQPRRREAIMSERREPLKAIRRRRQ